MRTFVSKLAVVAVALSLIAVPAQPAVAAPLEALDVPATLTPAVDEHREAAARAARILNRRVAPPVVQPVVQRVVQTAAVKHSTKPAKPAVKTKPVVKKTAPKTEAVTVPASGRAGVVIAYARRQLGKPYIWAATGPSGFDCSGLVVASFRAAGISLPHQTGALIGRGRAVSRAQLQPGDLVFPSSGHVGIYIGGGMMIHSPHSGDHVRIASVYAFWAARRIV